MPDEMPLPCWRAPLRLTKGSAFVAFVMGWPDKQAVTKPVTVAQFKAKNVEGKLKWT